MTEDEILIRLKRVLFLEKETIVSQVGGRFFSSLGTPIYAWHNEQVIRMMIRQTKRIMDLTNCKDKGVLEIGCGLGFNAIIMVLLGVGRMTAIDFNGDYIRMLRNMVRIIDEPKLYEKLHILPADARYIPLRTSQYDTTIIMDVLSHCQDLDMLVLEVNRVAKSNCVVYILDGNNGLKIREAKEVMRIQHLAEYGPLEEAHKKGRCIGIKTTYRDMRKEIIKRRFSSIDQETINKLAEQTSGMYGGQIISAVEGFLSSKNLSQCEMSFPNVCVVNPLYRNPINGMWPEIAFNPYKLKRYLNNNGISSSLVPYKHAVMSIGFRGFIKRQLATLVKILYPLSISFAPGFEVVGHVTKKQ